MAGKKQGEHPKWAVVRAMLHMRLKDVAAELNAPITHLRRLCRENGFHTWPGKRIRYLNSTGRTLKLDVDSPESSSRAGLAGASQVTKVAETKKEEDEDEDEEEEEEDMTGVPEPAVANPPPRKELVTLNLIDKIGSSSASN